jgi:hypothetical protein
MSVPRESYSCKPLNQGWRLMGGGRPVSEHTLRVLDAIEQEYVRTRKPLTYEQWAAKLIEVGLLSEDYDPKNLRYTLQKARRQDRIPKSALLIPHEAKSEAIAILAFYFRRVAPNDGCVSAFMRW